MDLSDYTPNGAPVLYAPLIHAGGQLDGVAMGSPLGPIAADIIMQKVLNDVLEMSPLRIDFVIKYVDDLLIAVHSEDKHLLTEAFGSIHDRIKFTIELEQEGKLPYLDLNIHRDRENKLSTSWYTKPSSSQRLLNYNSRHPRYTIVNVARNLIRRSRMLTTNPHENADNQVANILRKNDFPEGKGMF
uniref:Reverse transcriptase domain-containing protein n=1 Tax=Lutzomyia longipalpis TaxID=7200 RepID=A0A1B0CW15_LUTLO